MVRPSALGHRSRGLPPSGSFPFGTRTGCQGGKKGRFEKAYDVIQQLRSLRSEGEPHAPDGAPQACRCRRREGSAFAPRLGRSMFCRGGEMLKCRIRGPRAPRSARLAPFVRAASELTSASVQLLRHANPRHLTLGARQAGWRREQPAVNTFWFKKLFRPSRKRSRRGRELPAL